MKRSCLRPIRILLLLACGCLLSPLHASPSGDDYREADAELNKVYQKALKAMPSSSAKDALREDQRAWIAFRDGEAALYGEMGVNGSVARDHLTEMIGQRTAQLKEIAAEVQ